MLFILDGMHGKLTRWLRIAGYDVLYYRDKDDDDLIHEALTSNRVLLTRDKRLVEKANKAGVVTLLMEGVKVLDHLKHIKKNLTLEFNPYISRCPVCNGELSKKTREEVKYKIPELSLNSFDEFWSCNSCEKVYWKGSHWEKITEILGELR